MARRRNPTSTKPANWSSMTRQQRSAWNKADFRSTRGSRSAVPARSVRPAPRKAKNTKDATGFSNAELARWKKQAMKGKHYSEGQEPHEDCVILFTDRGTPNVPGYKTEWLAAAGDMDEAIMNLTRKVCKLADKHDMCRSYEGISRAQAGVYFVEFGS